MASSGQYPRRSPAAVGKPTSSYAVFLPACLASVLVGYAIFGSFVELSQMRSTIHEQNNNNKDGKTQSLRVQGSSKDTIHTLCTTNGSPYQNYQMRIAYGTYRLIQKMPGGERHTAFTRILHRTARDPDPLADEIPTFRADPLQPECDDWCEYPVSDRANAVNQFWKYAEEAGLLREDWYYMIESDYVFMKPLDIPQGSDARKKAWGFSFSYIHPVAHPQEMEILYPGGDVNAIPSSGPAPILMTLDNWLRVTNDWEDMAAKIEANDAIKKKLGWVREMYGFSIAVAKNGIELDTTKEDNRFIVQPPADDSLGKAHAFHYTQCTIFKTMDDKDVWGYDKRFHTDPSDALQVPKIDPVPPFKEGQWKFIEGNPVTRKNHESISMMINQMNRAIETLKPLKAAHRS